MQWEPITTDVGLTPTQGEVYNICDKVCQWHLGQVGGFFLGPPVSSTNKTDRRDIAEILLKVVLSIYQTKPYCVTEIINNTISYLSYGLPISYINLIAACIVLFNQWITKLSDWSCLVRFIQWTIDTFWTVRIDHKLKLNH